MRQRLLESSPESLATRLGKIREAWNLADFLPVLMDVGIVQEDVIERLMLPESEEAEA